MKKYLLIFICIIINNGIKIMMKQSHLMVIVVRIIHFPIFPLKLQKSLNYITTKNQNKNTYNEKKETQSTSTKLALFMQKTYHYRNFMLVFLITKNQKNTYKEKRNANKLVQNWLCSCKKLVIIEI